MTSNQNIRVMRVVTDSRVVPWHLGKTLNMMTRDFHVIVVGENVTDYKDDYREITFIDVPITPKICIRKDFAALIKLILIIAKYKPHIVHSIMPKAGLLSAIAAFFLVSVRIHTFTGQVWQNMAGSSRKYLRYLDKLVVYLNTLCFTDSHSQSNFLFLEGIRDHGVALSVLSKGSLGGVDLDKISLANKRAWRLKTRSKYQIDDKSFVIGYLARKTREKGAILILDAFRRIREKYPFVYLMFIGPDDSHGELECHKFDNPDWGINVIEIGAVFEHEEYLASLDLFCLPSFREGFGSIVIDAAALAIPTVGSRISGLVDAVVDCSTGMLFECGNCDDLYEKLCFFIESPESVKNYGSAAYERVLNHFDSSIIYSELKKAYLRLLTNSH